MKAARNLTIGGLFVVAIYLLAAWQPQVFGIDATPAHGQGIIQPTPGIAGCATVHPATPVANQALVADSSDSCGWFDQSGGGGGSNPTGPASGCLAGNYPGPTFAVTCVPTPQPTTIPPTPQPTTIPPTPQPTFAYIAPTPFPTCAVTDYLGGTGGQGATCAAAPTPQPTFAYTPPTPQPTFAYTAPTPFPTCATTDYLGGTGGQGAACKAVPTPQPTFAYTPPTPQPTFAYTAPTPFPTCAVTDYLGGTGGQGATCAAVPTPQPTFAYTPPTPQPTFAYTAPTPFPTCATTDYLIGTGARGASCATPVPTPTGIPTGNTFSVFATTLTQQALGAGVNDFVALMGNSSSPLGSEINEQVLAPATCTVKNLYVQTSTSQTATGSLVISYRPNGVNSSLVVTIAAGAGIGIYSDLTHTAAFVQGQTAVYNVKNNGTNTSAAIVSISALCVP